MATPRERASGLLHGFLDVGMWSARSDPDELEGTLGALECVGLLSLQDAEVWRAEVAAAPQFRVDVAAFLEKAEAEWCAELARATRQPGVGDAASLEQAAGVLSELLDAVGEVEAEQQLARAVSRFQGALAALTEVGAVDREHWEARLRERRPLPQEKDEKNKPTTKRTASPNSRGGSEQELVGVIAGSSELLDGWRVLYGLRFEDGISFTLWRDPGAGPGPRDWNAQDVWIAWELRDSVGTGYGGADSWGADDGARGVSFAVAAPADATWVEVVNEAGHAVRLAL